MTAVAGRLTAHLRHQLGAWPPSGSVVVTTSPGRARPGWDRVVRSCGRWAARWPTWRRRFRTCSAGGGRKCHDRWCTELAVGTEAEARGRGLARRLVATAARRVLDEGKVPTYQHDVDNDASAHVADAVGFPDRGLRGLWLV